MPGTVAGKAAEPGEEVHAPEATGITPGDRHTQPATNDTNDTDTTARARVNIAGKDRSLFLSQSSVDAIAHAARIVLREPFTKRPWIELFSFCVTSALVGASLFVLLAVLGAGLALAVTFVGLFVIGLAVQVARGLGGWFRGLGLGLLGEAIEPPAVLVARPGAFGWMQSATRDRAGWRAMAYMMLRALVGFVGIFVALSVWVSAATCLTYPLTGNGNLSPGQIPLMKGILHTGYYTTAGSAGFFHALFIVLTGVVLVFVAPWPTHLLVVIDRSLMRALLGPDAVEARTRVLEQARNQTVDDAAATLRRIERDLHDGTQAQLVALAMRLGQAKEALALGAPSDVDEARRLVDEAHRNTKEAIVELRDLARGIHPPVLDTGLEGALTTLAARSTLPTALTFTMAARPTAAVEAIAYFCVAELLANVAQHAHASRASVSCVQHGGWLRLVVRDDGDGGAAPALVGSSSSGLAGLAERVRAVDGHVYIESPFGGPTVVTADVPLRP